MDTDKAFRDKARVDEERREAQRSVLWVPIAAVCAVALIIPSLYKDEIIDGIGSGLDSAGKWLIEQLD